jgi:hypothetical protein
LALIVAKNFITLTHLISNHNSLGIASIRLGDDPLWTAIEAATAITINQSLARGDFRPSPSGNFKIGLDGISGELVIVDTISNTNYWGSGVPGGQQLILQADGNLVVKDVAHKAVWSTDTFAQAGCRLTLEDNGEAAIVHGTVKIWSTLGTGKRSIFNPNLAKFGEKVVLHPLESLQKGNWVSSPTGSYKVGLNLDGDFLFQDSADRTIWRANVQGGGRSTMLSLSVRLLFPSNETPLSLSSMMPSQQRARSILQLKRIYSQMATSSSATRIAR